jgi:hypothetical protein
MVTVVESPDQRVDPVPGTIFAVRYDSEDHTRIAIDADKVAEDLWTSAPWLRLPFPLTVRLARPVA